MMSTGSVNLPVIATAHRIRVPLRRPAAGTSTPPRISSSCESTQFKLNRCDLPWPILMAMWATVTHLNSHAAESDSANHRQAEYFREELHRKIGLLDAHIRNCQAKLATTSQRGQVDQVRRMQSHLRNGAVERRELVDMLAALTRRFPDEGIALTR